MRKFNTHKSVNLRIWHWLSFFSIVVLMLTYIVRKTWLNYKDNAIIIQDKLSEFSIIITDDQSKAVAKILRDNMFVWHYWAGFLFSALLIYRFYGIFIKKDNFVLKEALQTKDMSIKGAKLAQTIFYIVSAYMAASGIIMYIVKQNGIKNEIYNMLKAPHEYLFWFFAIFIVAHIAGVIKAELTTDNGLISSMFSNNRS